LIAIGGLYALMFISFVAVPARILGVKKNKLPPRQAIGSWTVGSALSAVAMTPGFVLDRLGLILLGIPQLRIPGFVLLSIGTALYAAGMSSVKAVKLCMKFEASK
jgi:stage V sporulation protein SpoVS